MSVVVVGLNERDAPLELLERLTIADADLPKALRELRDSPHISEAVVLSTCMRTEVYAVVGRFHDGVHDIERFFQSRLDASGGDDEPLGERLVVAFDDAAAEHLFGVASGIDSAVLGEGEVLRQVRHAADRARHEGAAGPWLGGLFRHAVEVGKRARTETGIARGVTSLSHVAVALAVEHSGGSLAGRRAVVVGAGEMGEGIVQALAAHPGSPEIVVANRGRARAASVAGAVGAKSIDLARLREALFEADVLIAATTAGGTLLSADDVRDALAGRSHRPLLVVDTAVPRDIDPAVGDLDDVQLFDLDDLRAFAETEMASRRAEVERVKEIIVEELRRYRADTLGRSVAPVVAALRARAEEIRGVELAKHARLLASLDDEQRQAVEALTRGMVNKLVHEPTVQVKHAAGSAEGERLAEALRALFGL